MPKRKLNEEPGDKDPGGGGRKRIRRLSPAPKQEVSRASRESSVDEIPYVPLVAPGEPRQRRTIPSKAALEAARKLALMAQLKALPEDVQLEYLGPNFNFEDENALEPYERGLGLDRFVRIARCDPDIPNILIRLHPDLFVSLEKFRELAAFCPKPKINKTAKQDEQAEQHEAYLGNLWRRHALAEARPYRSDNDARVYCKQQRSEMDKKLSRLGFRDRAARKKISARYQANKHVDARTYTALKALVAGSSKNADTKRHLSYLKSKTKLGRSELARLKDYNVNGGEKPPEMLARKGEYTFISGELAKASQDLLKANIFELYDEQQIQLMNHYPKGAQTGEYKSLFTHAKGNFALPSAAQTEQLGLPKNFAYRKENTFEEQYQHRDNFYGSMRPPEGVNSALERDNTYMFREMDFDALLKSDYHRVRIAISLLEDGAPIDLNRSERIKGLLDLDDNLRKKRDIPERSRERSAGRG